MFQKSSFPFYGDITHQNRKRHWCDDADAAVLLSPIKNILPFFFQSDTTPTINNIKLVKNDTEYYDITSALTITHVIDAGIPICYSYSPLTELSNVTGPNITNSAGTSIAAPPTLWDWFNVSSEYYIKMTVDGDPYFSDIFKFFDVTDHTTVNKCGMISISWTSTKDVGDIVYSKGSLTSKVYVNSDEGRPTYSIIEESEEDSSKDKAVTFARSVKQYEIDFLANESLCDSLSLMPLCDSVYIVNQYGEGRFVRDVEIDFEWQSDCVAKVKMKYTTDRFMKKNC